MQLRMFQICSCLFLLTGALAFNIQEIEAQERIVEWSAHPLIKTDQSASGVAEAVQIVDVRVGELSITIGRPFIAGDDWLRGLCFRLKNVSGRPIIGSRLSFSLPETRINNNGLGFSLEYGRGESTGIPSDEQRVIMPNEQFELKFNDQQYERHRKFVTSRSNLPSFSKVIIGNIVVKFDDESIWTGGCLRAADPSNSCHPPAA